MNGISFNPYRAQQQMKMKSNKPAFKGEEKKVIDFVTKEAVKQTGKGHEVTVKANSYAEAIKQVVENVVNSKNANK